MKLVSVCVLLVLGTAAEAKRFGGFGGGRRGGSSSSKHRTPSPPSPPSHTTYHGGGGGGSSGTFLNAERGGGGGGGGSVTTHNRGNPWGQPAPPNPPPHTNGPIGFERLGNTGNTGGHQIGFDKVNSQANKPNPHTPSAPVGPPPAYGSHPGGGFGGNDHPPAYPGRPVNAPPSYTPNQHYPTNQHYPNNQNYPNNQHYPNNQFGNGFPHNNQYNPNYGSSHYGNSYGNFPAGGSAFGGGYHPNTYQGNTFGGSPFASGGYSGNPYYSPNNFGYSNNPGYFGGGGYGGNYGYEKKSRFGGLPIPIPIPIPIPLGGGGFGGFGGFGGHSHSYNSYNNYNSHSYNHRVLDTFIKSSNTSDNTSTSVFLLNNNTVTPCTTDHFVYGSVKVSTMACTAQFCTAAKVQTTTNVSSVQTVHGGAVTLCLEGGNATVSSSGEIVMPTVSEVTTETLTVCRNVTVNRTSEETTTTTTTSAPETTTLLETTTTTTTTTAAPVNTTVCEKVNCSSVEMCLPSVELVDPCSQEPCPFKRTGYRPCVRVKMCQAPSAPLSSFATLNTTISKIDELNRYQSVSDAANLTLISYHPPVTPSFDGTTNTTTTTTVAP